MTTFEQYKKARNNMTTGAKHALAEIRASEKELPSQIDGFDITWKIDSEDYMPCEDLGTFTNTWQLGALQNFPRERLAYKWFIPEYPIAERIETLNNKYWGMSKQNAFVAANKAAREDMEKAKELHWVYVEVTISKKGTILSTAGMSADSSIEENKPYLNEVLNELIPEALENAKKQLKELCTCA